MTLVDTNWMIPPRSHVSIRACPDPPGSGSPPPEEGATLRGDLCPPAADPNKKGTGEGIVVFQPPPCWTPPGIQVSSLGGATMATVHLYGGR